MKVYFAAHYGYTTDVLRVGSTHYRWVHICSQWWAVGELGLSDPWPPKATIKSVDFWEEGLAKGRTVGYITGASTVVTTSVGTFYIEGDVRRCLKGDNHGLL